MLLKTIEFAFFSFERCSEDGSVHVHSIQLPFMEAADGTSRKLTIERSKLESQLNVSGTSISDAFSFSFPQTVLHLKVREK